MGQLFPGVLACKDTIFCAVLTTFSDNLCAATFAAGAGDTTAQIFPIKTRRSGL